MGSCKFSTTIRILKLGGCDIVIKVDLMRQLSPITFNFEDQSIKFNRGKWGVTRDQIGNNLEDDWWQIVLKSLNKRE